MDIFITDFGAIISSYYSSWNSLINIKVILSKTIQKEARQLK